MATLLEAERETRAGLGGGGGGGGKLREIFAVRRNRNAALASEVVMFFQQFCGVNIIAYYSTEIFIQGGFEEQAALAASLGFGVVNWLFAIPGMYTIDTFGRRNLLLATFPVRSPCSPLSLSLSLSLSPPLRKLTGLLYHTPLTFTSVFSLCAKLMSLFMFFTGFSHWIPQESPAHLACIALGVYLFGVVYSPGEGVSMVFSSTPPLTPPSPTSLSSIIIAINMLGC